MRSAFWKALSIGAAMLMALAFTAVIGCSSDDGGDDGGNNNENGNGSGDFARMKIVGTDDGEPPQTVAVGSFTVLAVIPTDSDGKPVQLEEEHEYWKSVTWKSSDAAVATVFSQPGTGASSATSVQALKAGKTTITGTYKDKSASISLTVQ